MVITGSMGARQSRKSQGCRLSGLQRGQGRHIREYRREAGPLGKRGGVRHRPFFDSKKQSWWTEVLVPFYGQDEMPETM